MTRQMSGMAFHPLCRSSAATLYRRESRGSPFWQRACRAATRTHRQLLMSLLICYLVFPLFFRSSPRAPYGLFVDPLVRSFIRHPATAAGEKNRWYLDDASLARESFPLLSIRFSPCSSLPTGNNAFIRHRRREGSTFLRMPRSRLHAAAFPDGKKG